MYPNISSLYGSILHWFNRKFCQNFFYTIQYIISNNIIKEEQNAILKNCNVIIGEQKAIKEECNKMKAEMKEFDERTRENIQILNTQTAELFDKIETIKRTNSFSF